MSKNIYYLENEIDKTFIGKEFNKIPKFYRKSKYTYLLLFYLCFLIEDELDYYNHNQQSKNLNREMIKQTFFNNI